MNHPDAALAALLDEASLQPLEQHTVYERLSSLEAIRTFMESHVFAVWDFMALLKSIQRRVTSVGAVWTPPQKPALARFVNDLVLAEESDEISQGRYASHFHLYLDAMDEIGADSSRVRAFVQLLQDGADPRTALVTVHAPEHVRRFVDTTLDYAESDLHVSIAALLWGREDPIPGMFTRILEVLDRAGLAARSFRVYLERHCILDAEHHGPLASNMLTIACENDPEKVRTAQRVARAATEERSAFWTAIEHEITRITSL